MEYDAGLNDKEQKKGCCSKIPCCRTTCGKVISCIVCCPIILILLILLVIVLWGAASGGDNPPSNEGPKSNVQFQIAASDTDAMTNNFGAAVQADIIAAITNSTGGSATFVSVATAKAPGNVNAIFSVEFLNGLNLNTAELNAFVLAVINDPAHISLGGATGVDTTLGTVVAHVNCIMDGLKDAGFSKALCTGAFTAALDTNKDTLLEKIDADIDPGYSAAAVGVDNNARIWASLKFDSSVSGAKNFVNNTGGTLALQHQQMSCETFVLIKNNMDEVSKVIKDYFSECAIKTTGLKCKISIGGNHAKDHSDSCANAVNGDLVCQNCLCNQGRAASLAVADSSDTKPDGSAGTNQCII